MNTLYGFNQTNNSFTQTSFNASPENWFISASKNEETIYFQNLSSFKHWSNTCCGQSRDAIFAGQLGDYSINYNRP